MGFNHTFGGRGRKTENAWIESFVKQLNMIRSTPTPGAMDINFKKACVNILNTIIKKNQSIKMPPIQRFEQSLILKTA